MRPGVIAADYARITWTPIDQTAASTSIPAVGAAMETLVGTCGQPGPVPCRRY